MLSWLFFRIDFYGMSFCSKLVDTTQSCFSICSRHFLTLVFILQQFRLRAASCKNNIGQHKVPLYFKPDFQAGLNGHILSKILLNTAPASGHSDLSGATPNIVWPRVYYPRIFQHKIIFNSVRKTQDLKFILCRIVTTPRNVETQTPLPKSLCRPGIGTDGLQTGGPSYPLKSNAAAKIEFLHQQWTIGVNCKFTSYYSKPGSWLKNHINQCGGCNSVVGRKTK